MLGRFRGLGWQIQFPASKLTRVAYLTTSSIRIVNLEDVYTQILDSTLGLHWDALRPLLAPDTTSKSVALRWLISRRSPELYKVRAERSNSVKLVAPAAAEAAALRELYAPVIDWEEFRGRIESLPFPQARYLQPTYLEDTIGAAMSGPSTAWRWVFKLLIDADLPVSARERARYLSTVPNASVDSQFEEWRVHFEQTNDVGTLNTLLDVALGSRSRRLESFVEAQLATTHVEDRFTQLTRLKWSPRTQVLFELNKFREKGYVMDTTALALVLSTLLRAGLCTHAERALTAVETAHLTERAAHGNPARLSNLLTALDTVSRALQQAGFLQVKVPTFPSPALYLAFLKYYIGRGDAAAGLSTILRMCEHACFPERHQIYALSRILSSTQRAQLRAIVIDINDAKPGIITPALDSTLGI